MTDIEPDFKAAFMKQAYLDFLSFACNFSPMLKQFEERAGKNPGDNFEEYRVWVTKEFWGDDS